MPANEWLLIEGKKVSKTRTEEADVFIPSLLAHYPPDVIRFYAALLAPQNHDTELDWDEFHQLREEILANQYGNLVQRTLVLARDRCGGKVRAPPEGWSSGTATAGIGERLKSAHAKITEEDEKVHLKEALDLALEEAREANRKFHEARPWQAPEAERDRALYETLWRLKALATWLSPVLPFSSAEVFRMLGYGGPPGPGEWEVALTPVPVGQALGEVRPLFPRPEAEPASAPEAPPTAEGGWPPLAVCAGIIRSVAVHPSADKLYVLEVDVGAKTPRTLVAGLRSSYPVEALKDRPVVLLTNLAQRTIRRITSAGDGARRRSRRTRHSARPSRRNATGDVPREPGPGRPNDLVRRVQHHFAHGRKGDRGFVRRTSPGGRRRGRGRGLGFLASGRVGHRATHAGRGRPGGAARLRARARSPPVRAGGRGRQGPLMGRIRLDLHVHSRHSPDSELSLESIVSGLASVGLNGFALTDHNSVAGHRELAALQAKFPGLILVPGVEVSTLEGHLLVYDVSEAPPRGRPVAETVDWVRDRGGVSVLSHPFRARSRGRPRRRRERPRGRDRDRERSQLARVNRKAADVATRRGLGVTGGSDVHALFDLGRAYAEFSEGTTGVDTVLRSIRERTSTAGGRSLTFPDRLRYEWRTALLRLRSGFPTDLARTVFPLVGFKAGSPALRCAKVAEWLMRRTADPFPGGSIPSLGLKPSLRLDRSMWRLTPSNEYHMALAFPIDGLTSVVPRALAVVFPVTAVAIVVIVSLWVFPGISRHYLPYACDAWCSHLLRRVRDLGREGAVFWGVVLQ